MKIIVTGHTKGIGKCLYEKFKSQGHEVVGFSRSTGHDIEQAEIRNFILEQADSADIFINNAYAPTGQTLLFADIVDKWSDTDKYIINLSSKLSLFPVGKEADLDDYIVQKQLQNKIANERIFAGSPRILNVIIGLVNTEMSTVFNGPKISPDKLASLIYDLTQNKDMQIQQIIVDVPGLNWKNIQRF